MNRGIRNKIAHLVIGMVIVSFMSLSAQARSLDEIKASGEIRFCIWASGDPDTSSANKAQPPGCRDDCTFTGFFYEWSLAFADWLGPEVQAKYWRMTSWDEHFHNAQGEVLRDSAYTPALLDSATCDLYPTWLGSLPWRENKIDIVPLLVEASLIMIHKSNSDTIKTLVDLGGKLTEGGEGGWWDEWAREQNRTVLVDNPIRLRDPPEPDISKSYDDLDAGKLDFLGMDAAFAMNMTRTRKNVVAAFAVEEALPVGWGFRKQDKDLQAAAKAFFDEQRSNLDSPLNKAWEGYTGMSIPRFIELVTAIK